VSSSILRPLPVPTVVGQHQQAINLADLGATWTLCLRGVEPGSEYLLEASPDAKGWLSLGSYCGDGFITHTIRLRAIRWRCLKHSGGQPTSTLRGAPLT